MDFNMNIPGLKDCIHTNMEERDEMVILHVELERKVHTCSSIKNTYIATLSSFRYLDKLNQVVSMVLY
ncbi:hypothetical protein [Ornithinibacillus contaminans]|uniref:hypothetical protein n=1 Tax=Ornithinibacillus contaminans TaxID=694055 RepID=UPI00064DC2B1|nr:hypothetical protein [Ornithinibacillus contaminans]